VYIGYLTAEADPAAAGGAISHADIYKRDAAEAP